MTKTNTNRDKIAEALQSNGLHNSESNRAKILAKVQEVGEDVKHLESVHIERSNTADVHYVWITYQKNGTRYNKQNGCGYSLQLEEMTTRQQIDWIINSNEWKKEHAKKHLTANGWRCERVKDNKPQTLQDLAETLELCNYLYYFLFVEDYNGRKLITISGWDTLRKRATRSACPGWFWGHGWNLQDCNDRRKKAYKIYLLKAPAKEGAEMVAKYEVRRNNWHKVGNTCEIMPTERRNLARVHLAWSCCGYNGEGWKVYSVDGVRVFDELTTQDNEQTAKAEAISLVYDKSGYRRGERIAELKKEARKIKAEKIQKEWETTDKSEYIKDLEGMEARTIDNFLKVANSGAFDFYTLHRLEDIGECVRDIKKVKEKITTYKSAQSFAEDFIRCQRLAKKCAILAPLHADPLAYGFSWWELQPDGSLKNRHNDKDYYITISPASVGSVAA